MNQKILLASFVILLILLASSPLIAQDIKPVRETNRSDVLAFTNVTLIDGTGVPPRSSMTVIVKGDKIDAIFPTGEQPIPPSAEELDLDGRFLIPGLINTHLHLPMLGWNRDSVTVDLVRMFYAGVTSIRDPAGDARLAAELDRARLIDDAQFPSIYWAARIAGPTFYKRVTGTRRSWIGYAAGEAPWAQVVTADSDLARTVSLAAGAGATGLKLYADLQPGVVRRLINEAHRQGLMAWAHGTIFPTGPLEAVRSGINSLSHTCLLLFELNDEIPSSRFDAKPLDSDSINLDNRRFYELLNEMRIHEVVMDATVRKQARIWATRHIGCSPSIINTILRSMHEAEGPISTGTDFFLPDGEPDPTLFSEIEYLVESDVLSPLEVITAATLNGARTIGIEDTYGSIVPGKVADLVILSDDPTEKITALQSVFAIVKDGQVYYRTAYNAK